MALKQVWKPTLLILMAAWVVLRRGPTFDGSVSVGTTESGRSSREDERMASCRNRLDRLDRVFDAKRRARQNSTYAAAVRPKSVPVLAFDPYEPEANCFSEERFGGSPDKGRYDAFGDGPKFVCGVDVLRAQSARAPHSNGNDDDDPVGCLVYSVGSNNEIDFEVAVRNFIGDCEVHTFDHTLKNPFQGDAYATFHPWAWGADDGRMGNGRPRKTFDTVYRELGHAATRRRIDILKIDCEGCEFQVLPPLLRAMARGDVEVDQILVEMHAYGLAPDALLDGLADFFRHVDAAHMRITHKERNHWGCQGHRCLEYALVSESFLRRANEKVICHDE